MGAIRRRSPQGRGAGLQFDRSADRRRGTRDQSPRVREAPSGGRSDLASAKGMATTSRSISLRGALTALRPPLYSSSPDVCETRSGRSAVGVWSHHPCLSGSHAPRPAASAGWRENLPSLGSRQRVIRCKEPKKVAGQRGSGDRSQTGPIDVRRHRFLATQSKRFRQSVGKPSQCRKSFGSQCGPMSVVQAAVRPFPC